jgi:hypothetical protein
MLGGGETISSHRANSKALQFSNAKQKGWAFLSLIVTATGPIQKLAMSA